VVLAWSTLCDQAYTVHQKYCMLTIRCTRCKTSIIQEGKEMTTSVKMTENECSALYVRALQAGREAGDNARPTPMHVVQEDGMGNVIKRYEPVMDGVCGFGWVNIRPGNCSFANWLKKRGHARRSYSGGVDIWISDYGQSYERKVAHARAMAQVFTDAGITAYGTGRVD
jgi:DNA-directed RNA polymerase subunit N (RpoN/RPB10)